MTNEQWQALRQQLILQFRLGPHSPHDHDHWDRVALYGQFVGLASGADLKVVRLFALFHDSCRHSDHSDPQHGPRAAELAGQLCGHSFDLSPERLALLQEACRNHERGLVSTDPTVGSCWDADRLDLDRVGIATDEALLSTDAGKRLSRLRPLDRRAKVGIPV